MGPVPSSLPSPCTPLQALAELVGQADSDLWVPSGGWGPASPGASWLLSSQENAEFGGQDSTLGNQYIYQILMVYAGVYRQGTQEEDERRVRGNSHLLITCHTPGTFTPHLVWSPCRR